MSTTTRIHWTSGTQLHEYYPGDDYVDWLAMSAYGKQFRTSHGSPPQM